MSGVRYPSVLGCGARIGLRADAAMPARTMVRECPVSFPNPSTREGKGSVECFAGCHPAA